MHKSKLKSKFSFVFILLILISGLLLLGGTLQLGNGQFLFANAQVDISVTDEIESEYAFGDKFTVPVCTFTKEGDSATGVASLQFPDGTQTNKTEVTLNQSGRYVLRYIATIADKTYTKEYGFRVYGRLASYNNEKTSFEYGLCTKFGANSTGLTVRIANGDSLTFDHVFDMGEMTMATKPLEGFVVPDTQGHVDFSKMVFTFTDLEDPSVQLVYHGNFYDDSNAHGLTYFTAAGNGQIHCGLESVGRLHVGTSLGCMVPHSFMAVDTGLYWGAQAAQPAAPDAKMFCISYDSKTNQAWAGGKIISDLDDSNYYDSLWFGFPSGKAKLTISALNYNNTTANICFTSILGVDLSSATYIDEKAPEITVRAEYDEMPYAVVGCTYPIPTASAIDEVSGVCDVRVAVWQGYGSDNQKMVNVNENCFKVEDVGAYAIVYEATDRSGNVSRKVLWVRSYLSQYAEKLTVFMNESFGREIEVGTMQSLPEVTVSGNSGDYTVTYTITKGKDICAIVNEKFCLEQAGEWLLTCTAEDYIGRKAVAVCTIKGIASGKPVLLNEPKLPMGYVSGASYQLPVLDAYDYTSGVKVQKLCDVSVIYDGTSKAYKAGETFVPTVHAHNDTVKVVYSCDGIQLWEKDIPVSVVFEKERIPGNTERYRDIVLVENYFCTEDDMSFTNKYELTDVKGLLIATNQATDGAKASFINAQIANAFSLNFMTVPNRSKFSQLNITLTDSENSNISVKAMLKKDDGQTVMQVGDTVLTLTLDFDGAAATAYNIGFRGGQFVVNTTTKISVSKTEQGEKFNGFPSGKVYFDIEMVNAEADAAIFLSKICDVNTSNTQDNTGSVITTAENVITNAFKDSVYTVQKVLVGDVLCPNTKATLTVLAPDGTVVKSVGGTELKDVDATKDYQITLSSYGDYNVSVTAVEADGWKYSNPSYFKYVVSVIDGERPTIEFTEDFETELEVGDRLVIPSYVVSDNYSSADKITVMTVVTNPKGMPIYLIGEINALRCEYAGIYQIKVYVYDEMGNLTVFETSVAVK